MKIESGGKGVDVSFYESFREVLKPFMAKQRLKELHSRMLKLRLRRIREEQSRETVKHEEKEPPLVFDVEHASRPSTSKTAKLLDHDEGDVKMDVEHAKIVQVKEFSAHFLPKKLPSSNLFFEKLSVNFMSRTIYRTKKLVLLSCRSASRS